jgi:8-amino-7-oxononanoate synthase
MPNFRTKLRELEAKNRYRILKRAEGIDLTSNDYIGLRSHPELRKSAIAALEGGIEIGAGGSRLLRGHTEQHAELEEFAASYFGAEAALYFATGFQANAAIFPTLCERGDTIIFDALIHASAREGIQASLAAHRRVAHNDLDAFETALRAAKGQKWIAVESVYSMDGDVAPLIELYGLATKYDAVLIVDEAHGTGVFGANGKGVSEGLPHENLIVLHTCGKALGVAGGLVCGSRDVIDYMINKARPFIYSTAPLPLQAVLVKRALELVRDEPQRRADLFKKIKLANQALGMESASQIIPIILGDDARAVEIAASLQESGFDVRAIRPPTVPEGTARLRVSISTNLSEKNISDFAAALAPHLRKEAA